MNIKADKRAFKKTQPWQEAILNQSSHKKGSLFKSTPKDLNPLSIRNLITSDLKSRLYLLRSFTFR